LGFYLLAYNCHSLATVCKVTFYLEEHKFKEFENKELKKTRGLKKEEVREEVWPCYGSGG
jgi:hypothetical protein